MLWCETLHGLNTNSSPNIDTYWIFEDRIYLNDFYNDNLYWIDNYRGYILTLLSNSNINNTYLYHPKLNVIYRECLPGNECVACIKTIWIKLIQRRWKKLFKIRNEIIKQRATPKSMYYRELNGTWPNKLKTLPSIMNIINF